jgi:predicted permease
MSAVTYQIAIIFIGIAIGFFCRKIGVMDEKGTGVLSAVIIKVILPLYLFNAILRSGVAVSRNGVLLALGLSLAMFLICGFVGILVTRAMRTPPGDRGVYEFELMCGNVTYIGIPVCAAVLGESAVFYASLLNISYSLLCFSLGIFLLSGKLSLRGILNPAFLIGLLATLLYLAKVPVPSLLLDTAKFMGQATSPCAMLVIGSALGSVPLTEIFTEWRAIPYVFFRLIGSAAVVAFCFRLLNIDPVLKGVLILMAAMPAATNSTMLTTIYGGNRALSAKLIFLSTALSILTIPLWATYFF